MDDINLSIPRGEFFVVLGPQRRRQNHHAQNPEQGLIKPTSGTARVGGFDVQTHPLEARRRLAYVPDFPFLYEKLTPWEFFRFTGQMFQMDNDRIHKPAGELITRFNLEPYVNKPIEGLSHGTRQRVAIVSALLHDPEVFVIARADGGTGPASCAAVVKDILKERSRARHDGFSFDASTKRGGGKWRTASVLFIRAGWLHCCGTREELRHQSGASSGPLEEIFFLHITAQDARILTGTGNMEQCGNVAGD